MDELNMQVLMNTLSTNYLYWYRYKGGTKKNDSDCH